MYMGHFIRDLQSKFYFDEIFFFWLFTSKIIDTFFLEIFKYHIKKKRDDYFLSKKAKKKYFVEKKILTINLSWNDPYIKWHYLKKLSF